MLATVPAMAQAPATQAVPLASAAPVITYTPMQRPTPARPPSTPQAPPQSLSLLASPTITAAQLEAIAELFSAPREEVRQRLQLDPELVVLALEAARRGKEREQRGKVMTGLGWTLVGVGLSVAVGILMNPSFSMSCGDGCQTTKNKVAGEDTFLAVAFGWVALGLGVAIPGMFVLRQTSDIENQAVLRYQLLDPERSRTPPRPIANAVFHVSTGRSFQFPLLSFRF